MSNTKPEPEAPETTPETGESDQSNPSHLADIPEEDLRKYVRGVLDGTIYSWQAHGPVSGDTETDARAIGRVFLVIAMGGLQKLSEGQMEDIGDIYEEVEKAGPRCINGEPMFFGCRLLNKAQFRRAQDAIIREFKRRESFDL